MCIRDSTYYPLVECVKTRSVVGFPDSEGVTISTEKEIRRKNPWLPLPPLHRRYKVSYSSTDAMVRNLVAIARKVDLRRMELPARKVVIYYLETTRSLC